MNIQIVRPVLGEKKNFFFEPLDHPVLMTVKTTFFCKVTQW